MNWFHRRSLKTYTKPNWSTLFGFNFKSIFVNYNVFDMNRLVCTVPTCQVWHISIVTGVTTSTQLGSEENIGARSGWDSNPLTSWRNATKQCQTGHTAWLHRESNNWQTSGTIFRSQTTTCGFLFECGEWRPTFMALVTRWLWY